MPAWRPSPRPTPPSTPRCSPVDLNALAYTAPAIREQWGLSIGQIGVATSAAFIGMFFGSIIGGRLADRFGRKRVCIGATLFYSLCSLLTAFSIGIVDLSIYRFRALTPVLGHAESSICWGSEMIFSHVTKELLGGVPAPGGRVVRVHAGRDDPRYRR
ncbi:MFS transporter (plasmid) [Rhodococcus rhodochrous]|uniref:MFS transporter n=2 Tax=Rhodococcus rhodochrous TaxID=1829 RepID=A0AA46X179_RHORH|nr:MFS transporter [Rhodococcus rhodochrous]UZF48244.1 MFS transporter [Rhodococcus rhodochrous]